MAAARRAREGGTLQVAAFEGRKFGILAFELQCVSVSLYLVHGGWVLLVGEAAPRTFALGGKNPDAVRHCVLTVTTLPLVY